MWFILAPFPPHMLNYNSATGVQFCISHFFHQIPDIYRMTLNICHSPRSWHPAPFSRLHNCESSYCHFLNEQAQLKRESVAVGFRRWAVMWKRFTLLKENKTFSGNSSLWCINTSWLEKSWRCFGFFLVAPGYEIWLFSRLLTSNRRIDCIWC